MSVGHFSNEVEEGKFSPKTSLQIIHLKLAKNKCEETFA